MSLLLSSTSSTPVSAGGQSSPNVLVPTNPNDAIALAVKLFGGQPVQEVLETPLAGEVREDLSRILRGSSGAGDEIGAGAADLTSPPDSPTKTLTQQLSPSKAATKLGPGVGGGPTAAAGPAGSNQASPVKSRTSTLFSMSSTSLSSPAKTSLSSPKKTITFAAAADGESARRDMLAELEEDLSSRLRLVDWATLQEVPDGASPFGAALEYETYEQELSTVSSIPTGAGGLVGEPGASTAVSGEQQMPPEAIASGALSSPTTFTRPEAMTTSMTALQTQQSSSPRRPSNDSRLVMQMLSTKREVRVDTNIF